MCGRYFIGEPPDPDELREIIEEVNRRRDEALVKTEGEIFPSDVVPVLANNRSMMKAVFPMRWGYSLPNGKLVINARSETAMEKPMFRDGMTRHRCVVPASHYFEWEHTGKEKTKYAIRPAGTRLMYMAGIYRMELGKPVFSILTRSPADNIRFMHDRMPVILEPDIIVDWMNPRNTAEEILKHAVLDVDYRKAEPEAVQQLSLL